MASGLLQKQRSRTWRHSYMGRTGRQRTWKNATELKSRCLTSQDLRETFSNCCASSEYFSALSLADPWQIESCGFIATVNKLHKKSLETELEHSFRWAAMSLKLFAPEGLPIQFVTGCAHLCRYTSKRWSTCCMTTRMTSMLSSLRKKQRKLRPCKAATFS